MIKTSLKIAIITGLITLAVWISFYIVTPEAPLDAASTTVVAAFFLLLIFLVRSFWVFFRKKKEN